MLARATGGPQPCEAEWWEAFSDIATRQWELTPRLNRIVRAGYLQEMRAHLFKQDGHLLEIGCGSGWAGLEVARLGMRLTGIDSSPTQIEKARESARDYGFEDARFVVGTVQDLPIGNRYDSILIHAVLHHLSDEGIEAVLGRAHALLKEGGRLYLYEPLRSARTSLLLRLAASGLFLVLYSPFWALHALAVRLRFGPPPFREAARRGWTGLSPGERPLDREWLLELLRPRYQVQGVRYWHAYGLALAMGCCELTGPLAWMAAVAVGSLHACDGMILQTKLVDCIQGVWSFASIRAIASGGQGT